MFKIFFQQGSIDQHELTLLCFMSSRVEGRDAEPHFLRWKRRTWLDMARDAKHNAARSASVSPLDFFSLHQHVLMIADV